jgi:hypothetical protein
MPENQPVSVDQKKFKHGVNCHPHKGPFGIELSINQGLAPHFRFPNTIAGALRYPFTDHSIIKSHPLLR